MVGGVGYRAAPKAPGRGLETTLGENDDRSTEAGEPVRLPIVGARPAAVGGATAVEHRMEDGRALLVYVWTEEAGP